MRLAVVSGILFLSGASALLFETLWLRLSGLAFGNSVWSAALILSSFMAGLALGSAIAAASNLPRLRPLQIYAGLEIIVAVSGCTLVFGLPLLGEWLRPIFQALWNFQPSLNPLRFSISFLILLIPTTAMGLTLPVLLEDPILKGREFGRTIGVLYGFNTLGAVGGALVGEVYLVRAFGLFGTGLTAAGLSCVAALIAVLLSILESPAEKIGAPFKLRLSLGTRPPWRLLFLSMGTGAILLSLEVIWFRFMRLYIASRSIAFCVMLAVVLLGISLGGMTSSAISGRFSSPRRLLPVLLLLAAVGTLLCYLFFPVPAVHAETKGFYIEAWQQVTWLSLCLMFPVAFLSGILFPTVVACVQREVPNRMNSAGLTILCNTVGAALGPIVAAFALLPWFGFQTSLIIAAVGYAGLAIIAGKKENWSFNQSWGRSSLALGIAFVAIVAIFPYHRAETHFANARRPYEVDGSRLLKKIEGNADTFQLLRRDLFGDPYYYRLVTNAYSMSGTPLRTQRYMRLFVYLPLALRPESEDALLLCYGVGVTADAFTRDAHLEHLDVVDISKEVFDLADYYSKPGYSNPLRDPRVTTFVQDGRFFLQACPKQYDIITGEPPPLKVAGTVNLYTQQFFSLARERLKDGGIVSFWLPIYQLSPDEAKAILRAFHNVFPNTAVWATCDLEWIMTGIKDPLSKPNEESARQLWTNPDTAFDLERIGIEVPEQMSALFLMDGDEIDRITQGIEPLTDFYPKRLSDVRSDMEAAYRFGYIYLQNSGALHRFLSSSLIDKIWPNEWKRSLEGYFFVRETRYRSEMSGSNWLAELDFYLRRTKLRVPVLNVRNSDDIRLALAEDFAKRSPSVPTEALPDLVAGALAQRDYSKAIQLLEIEKNRGFSNENDLFLLIYLYCLNDNVEEAEALAALKASSIQKDGFVDWLWGKLQAEFGFHPPR
jgi:predicted membrane-bound spermidine synthase